MSGLAALVVIAWLVAAGVAIPATPSNGTPMLATPAATTAAPEAAVPVALTIHNSGAVDDRLVAARTPVANSVDLHRTRLVDGRRVMKDAADGIAIPAGETLVLEPGGSHLMLVGLRADLVQGAVFPLDLCFEYAGRATVNARVRRKVDAAGLTPVPPVAVGDLSVSLASAPPAARVPSVPADR